MLQNYEQEGRPGLTRHVRSFGVVPAVESPKSPRAIVFIDCDPEAELGHLQEHGVRVNQTKGRVRTAIVPLEGIEALTDDEAVRRVHLSRALRLYMDVAPGKVHVPAFRLNKNLNGQNVVIGVVDTGIDPNHPAFQGRILRIWDQTLTGPGVAEGAYGLELTGAQMTASRDTEAHGTHVSGIAAGADPTYTGIAPGAEIVMVRSDLNDAHISDGIRYIFRVAADLNRAAVVNLSLGGHGDAHDGSDPLSQIIDSETGPGRIVCCAAGNEGTDNIHAQATVPSGASHTVNFRVPPNAVGVAMINGWYPGANSLEIAIQSPSGFVTPFQAVILQGSHAQSYNIPNARVIVATPGPDPSNGDHNFFVQITSPATGAAVVAGNWQLKIRNTSGASTRLDAWTLDDQGGSNVLFTGADVDDSTKIGSPGCSATAITVASYTTKTQWTDIDGAGRQVGLALDDISDFSSEGPLRDGAPKPDIAAPGAMIVSCLSADSTPRRADMIDQYFLVMAGTSMATPFTTGIVALLLERNRKLDPNGVKALLRANSAISTKPAGTFDTKWGFGLIDAAGL
jgi:subtilisin family serine protease